MKQKMTQEQFNDILVAFQTGNDALIHMGVKTMTWQELLQSNHETVIVQSYGYTEHSSFSSHFEPFSHLREFKFEIGRAMVNGKLKPEYSDLSHKWLYLEEPESELTFEEKDGKVYCFDPDLGARP